MTGNVKFINSDIFDLKLDKNSIDLIITSPPYWMIDPFRYGGNPEDQINFTTDKDKFIKNLVDATNKMYDFLSEEGSLLINIGMVQDVSFRYIVDVLDQTEFKLHQTLIWDISESFYKTEFFQNSIQLWFHLSKSNKPYINPFMVKKNTGTILRFDPSDKNYEYRSELDKIGYSGDAFPLELIEILVKMYSKPRDLVLDPFGGSGIAAIAAIKNKRFAIINDISEQQIEMAKKRVEMFEEKNV